MSSRLRNGSLLLILGAAIVCGEVRLTKLSPVDAAFQLIREAGIPEQPRAISIEERNRILAKLPSDGELEPDTDAAAKLAALLPVLKLHDRETLIEIKIARLPFACVSYYERAVLIIAEHTIKVVTAEELQALVAHELGHEYLWREYYLARDRRDSSELQKIELLADAISLTTLLSLGRDPGSLMSGIRRMNAHNAKLGGYPINGGNYPSEQERQRFHERVLQLFHERGQFRGN